MSRDTGMDEEDGVYSHNRILLSHRKEETMSSAATWTDLETVVLK